MKRTRKLAALILAVVMALMLTVPASAATTTQAASVPLKSITLTTSAITIPVRQSYSLRVLYNPINTTVKKSVSWSSSNTAVATVSGGKVTAKKAGTATITARCGGKAAYCKVTVKAYPLKSISLNPSSKTVAVGSSFTITASYSPANTTDSKTITWTSSNTAVAVVSGGKVTAKKVGNATITAKCGTKTATCTVKVIIPVASVSIPASRTFALNETYTLKATVSPSNATNKTVTWTSSNTAVATVSGGKVTAKKEGTAVITAKCGGKTAQCKVTVKKNIPLSSITVSPSSKTYYIDYAHESFDIKVSYSPSNTTVDRTIKWTSSNSFVAYVRDGKVFCRLPGTAVITASCGDKKATITVTVKKTPVGYKDVSAAYTALNAFRTTKNQWQWNPDNKTKTYFNTNTSNKLPALQRNADLENTAKTRAKEISKKYSHTRPNGTACFTAFPSGKFPCLAECICVGGVDGPAAVRIMAEENCYYSGQGHRRIILDKDYQYVGIACYVAENGSYYWAMEFGGK